ncbi:YfhO family protein [Pseudochryseolinea flava]|uniref:YfhO family protein n=1 Tax=Pseudochryseolinea flava TaxID=2059302 RepID=A0A364Y2X1_9BACT|nr:YfhO family protein [Pseudochryseolinea flava]RAW01039.1 hypothetical protein DQQ10_12460 [Pseudochryseolinea flava]
MKKINFTEQVLPHIIAVAAFVVVTVFFFKPVFFDNQKLQQGDIQQWEGSSKALRDYREQTGEEGLWADMFSGMPAYLINVQWSYKPVTYIKKVLSLGLPHPIANIYFAFVCYYILLLAFGVRPYLSIAGAIAFGLSTYMIIGLSAGHSGRIGAIAFMPLVVAGLHLVFTNRRILGAGVTAAAMALQLIENHLQITYYLLIIVGVYMLVQFIYSLRAKQISEFFKNVAVVVPAAVLGVCTFVGPLWAISEYTPYSIRGKSELVGAKVEVAGSGLNKTYAFDHSNGILEPMSLMIPDFYGGSKIQFLVEDQSSDVFKALTSGQVKDQETANQLARRSFSYWGPQSLTMDYYAGAIMFFLFALGILFAERKYIWWLVPVGLFSIMLSWGSNFESFNYFLFEHLPGYSKFRSPSFAIVIFLFTLPLLGMIGLEKLLTTGIDKTTRKKILIAFAATGGLCLLIILCSGLFSFITDAETDLPAWFQQALRSDRQSLMIGDAFRSLIFITIVFIVIFIDLRKLVAPVALYAVIILAILIDLAVVNKRSLTENNFHPETQSVFAQTQGDKLILQDTSYYRVFNVGNPMNDAMTSYHHHSIGGYHGAKIRRYQDLFDSCMVREIQSLFSDAQRGKLNFAKYAVMNMLNVKYLKDGDRALLNNAANGAAWFVMGVIPANSPTDELQKVCQINSKSTAVIDVSKFTIQNFTADSADVINVVTHKPNYMKYESESKGNGLAVFSEIYYPEGWIATIDGKEVPIVRANYVLRALEIPAGKHVIEFSFKPDSYYVGNKITMASSWAVLLLLLGAIGYSFRKED